VVRRLRGRWVVAAIRPGGKAEGTWALRKGLIGAGERGEATALREVAEETGVTATPAGKLGDIRYV
jgi:8-oxo-dGTP pyrophosphatase MutT (NUDIX family)